MLTTVNFSDRRTDGGHGPFFDLRMPTVPQWTKEAEERVVELLRADISVGALLDACAAEGLEMRREWVGRIATKANIELKRGPKPGTGGRPPKGSGKRKQRGISLDPLIWEKVEAERQPDESINDVLERIIRRALNN